VPVLPVDRLADALEASDIVLSAFRAKGSPVIHGDAIRAGTLVCGISAVRPGHREIDMSLWGISRVVVDDLKHVCESGDGRAAVERGLTDDVPELWQVLRDPSLGRRDDDERVLFKSVGTAEQDIALAAIVVERAQALGLGEQLGEFPALRPIQGR
jgi:alanine dehydrogenase